MWLVRVEVEGITSLIDCRIIFFFEGDEERERERKREVFVYPLILLYFFLSIILYMILKRAVLNSHEKM